MQNTNDFTSYQKNYTIFYKLKECYKYIIGSLDNEIQDLHQQCYYARERAEEEEDRYKRYKNYVKYLTFMYQEHETLKKMVKEWEQNKEKENLMSEKEAKQEVDKKFKK